MKRVGIIDADLIGGRSTHPNLALMKLSAHEKQHGASVRWLSSYDDLSDDIVYVSKVFSNTSFPEVVGKKENVQIGGTGFFDDKAPPLAPEIESMFPDYELYNEYLAKLTKGKRNSLICRNYRDFSIGFLTRGCFRKCPFCVNRKYDKAFRAAHLSDFVDDSRPYIRLWDDNIFAFADWKQIFEELNQSGKSFVFQQGLDIRLLTKEKAEVLGKSNYWNDDFIFAFDRVADKALIEDKLELWSKYVNFSRKHYYAKVYVLCAYDNSGEEDVKGVFERIRILMKRGYLPYIMRYEGWGKTAARDYYVSLAVWCNMPHRFLKYSFREFVEKFGERSLGKNVTRRLQEQMANGQIDKTFFDMKYTSFR